MSGSNQPIWVVKIGSSLLTNLDRGLNHHAISNWVSQIKRLKDEGVSVVLVSSGAIAEGMVQLGWSKRPHELHCLQAAAAVGQVKLTQIYETQFNYYDLNSALILLTEADFSDRVRYLNARSTLRTLIELGVIPVINENDTVVNDEIRLGDNDTLAALVCNLLEADRLILLTDQEGLYDANPTSNPQAKLISHAKAGDKALIQFAGEGGVLGRGGMLTKVTAAQKAARSGTQTVICSGLKENILIKLFHGEAFGTLLVPVGEPVAARKRWLANRLKVRGELVLDDGAVKSLVSHGRSLLPVGVVSVTGEFKRGDLVVCKTTHGKEVARGLVNYNLNNSQRIIGQSSDQIRSILGFADESELIHRDNMVMTTD